MRVFEAVKGVDPKDVQLPERGTALSAGYDIRAFEDVVIPPLNSMKEPTGTLVRTGVKVYMSQREFLGVVARSSLFNKTGLMLANAQAIIDEDYYNNPDNDGEIFINLINLRNTPVAVHKGDRIAQGIFYPYVITDDDKALGERTGGLGSTGTN